VRARPFVCERGVCTQHFPQLPDDADWECADVNGLAVCRDRARAAGIVPGPPALGWICGGEPGHRICLDLAPDRPGAGNYDCRYTHEPSLVRTCRSARAPTLGGPCRGACPDGMICADGACVPRAIETPECWTSADCAEGERCLLAHCSS
jgi:hypothetical protein